MKTNDDVILKTISLKDLNDCTSTNEWDDLNPGLVIAYCSQYIYNADFPNSQSQENNGERFNVYASLRSFRGDMDSWYYSAKLPLGIKEDTNMKYNIIANDLISFHYISQIEAKLLYEIFSLEDNLSYQEFLDKWPKNSSQAGHYAAWRFKDDEGVKLYDFLTSQVIIHNEYCEV